MMASSHGHPYDGAARAERVEGASEHLPEHPSVQPAHRLVFTSHGTRIGIQADRAELLDGARAHLPPGARETPASPDVWYTLTDGASDRDAVLRVGRRPLARARDAESLLVDLESALHVRVSRQARRCLFVHAGVVEVHGRAVLIPGRSMSGKSTLVDALVRAGATYYSDEYAVLDPQGRVHPYAKPLSMREPGRVRPRRVPVAAPERATDDGTPPGLIVVTHHHEGTVWRPTPLTAGDALLALLANTVRVRRRPSFALGVLAAAVRGVPALHGARGEARATAEAILALLDRGTAAREVA